MARLSFVAMSVIFALIGVGCTSAPATQVSQPAQGQPIHPAPLPPQPLLHLNIASEPTAETSHASSDEASSDEIDCGARENACNAACLSANRLTSRIFLPEVADQAYDFTLPSVAGSEQSLSSYRGEKNVVVVFYRSFW